MVPFWISSFFCPILPFSGYNSPMLPSPEIPPALTFPCCVFSDIAASEQKEEKAKHMMRVLAVVLSLISVVGAMGQTPDGDYAERWKKVDKLISEKGLNRSALSEVEKIYKLAKKEKKDVQMIKALIYMTELSSRIKEETDHGLAMLLSELKTARAPVKQMLHSVVAGKYQHYLEANRYRLYGRTTIVSGSNPDPDTWGLEELHNQISVHYQASLTQADMLKKTRLEAYDPLIVKGNSRSLRPTLFDMLAHQALDYFGNDERDLTKPAYRFSMDHPLAFATAGEFSKTTFKTKDTSSPYYLAIRTYQQLLAFHLNDKEPSALIDADLARLNFMHQVSVLPEKDQLYLDALADIQNRYPQHKYGALAWVISLEKKQQDAMLYRKGISRESLRFALVDLSKDLQKISGRFPGTEADARAKNLLTIILTKNISAKTELVNVPGKPILAFVNYRNIDAFHYRIVAVDNVEEIRRDQKKYWEKLIALNPVQRTKQLLPDAGDLREHSVEIAVDTLPVGNYALLGSIKEDFSMVENEMTVQYFHVSNISHINRGGHYFLLHRESGQPLPNAEVRVMDYRFDQQLGRSVFKEALLKNTNPDGYIKLDLPEEVRQFGLDIRWRGDRLFTKKNSYYHRFRQPDDRPSRELTALFTDRSIYRPGQVVYFKGIKISSHIDGNKSTVVSGRQTTVRLQDANGELRDSLVLTTNSFGSYHGQFRITENLLTGNFSIIDSDGNSSISFQVEEYKRPTFETVFDAVAGQLRLGDTVMATGTVKGYAGNTLNDAKIRYRVVRRTVLPWRWGYGIWPPAMEETEISHGETVSDKDGKFRVSFKAVPDLSVSKDLYPQFNFEITADATDHSGETRSTSKNISIGYSAVSVTLGLDQDIYHADSLKTVKVTGVNAEGVPQKMAIQLIVQPLDATRRLLKERLWEVPDTSVMNRFDFSQLFPNDPYMNETDPTTWKKKGNVVIKNGSTGSSIKLDEALKPGYYSIEVTGKDVFGQEVKDLKYIRIRDNGNDPLHPKYISVEEDKKTSEPGLVASTLFGTSADNIFLIRLVDKGGMLDSSLPYKVEQMGSGVKAITIPVLESDRGGFDIMHLFVKHNRFFQVVQHIDVPWTNKQLDISVETWRNKLLPGTKETWTLKIKGAKGEKVAAELLTSMYDASLDQFSPHQWYFPDIFRQHQGERWAAISNFTIGQTEIYQQQEKYVKIPLKNYDAFLWRQPLMRRDEDRMYASAPIMSMQADGAMADGDQLGLALANSRPGLAKTRMMAADTSSSASGKVLDKAAGGPLSIRKNFNETAFFLPELRTDEQGDVSFTFTVPESLTRWKWQMLAHSPGLSSAMMTREAISQKDLMIQPNLPRFLREGDKVRLSARVSNLTEQEITGRAILQLIDPESDQPVDGWFQNIFPTQYFTVEAKQTTPVHFEIEVPANYNKPILYRITATAGQHTDGEENVLAVLSNRILVTESQPLLVKGNGSKSYQLKGLLASGNSGSLSTYGLTVEYSTNPAWYAVLALPYLMEQRQDCSEPLFNRFYANALASLTANRSPAVRDMFEKWRTKDTAAFISNLLKNPGLRSVLMEQTPWVLQAKNETEQRRNIARLFDMATLSSELSANLSKLREMQLSNGSFPWFKGSMDDRYITQYIMTGIGKLDKLEAVPAESRGVLEQIAMNALRYLDGKIIEDYEQLVKSKADLTKNNLGPLQVQYLYMRSFFKIPVPPSSKKAHDYYYEQGKQHWLGRNLISQGMIALVMSRSGNKAAALGVLNSLRENAIKSEELGMYWKTNTIGYFWYQSPVETQALLMEAFSEIAGDHDDVDDMKLWLLNQKRVQQWTSSRATADAVYALMSTGSEMLAAAPAVTVRLGEKQVHSSDSKQEAGTGHFTELIAGKDVVPAMGNIRVDVNDGGAAGGNSSGAGISWGAIHWQYFEDMDKVKQANTPVQLTRNFFIEKNSDKGPVLVPVKEGVSLKVGDRIKIRIILKADRDMEYMHLRDMRASGTEPVNVISSYKWQGGLGYYESTRDASTDFFFSWLPKGTWVFEYPVVVTHTGHFAAGISTIQSMYAPEFNAHSAGARVEVKE